MGTSPNSVKIESGIKILINGGYHCTWSSSKKQLNFRWKGNFILFEKINVTIELLSSMTISSVPWRIHVREAYCPQNKTSVWRAIPARRISCEIKTPYAGENRILLLVNEKFVTWNWNRYVCHKWKCEVDCPTRSTSCFLSWLWSLVQQDTFSKSYLVRNKI